MTRTLYLERPAFWTEPRDPEAWLRALQVLVDATRTATAGSPRTVWERLLRPTLSRRAALGLFGSVECPGGARLHGVGLLVLSEGVWRVGEGGWEILTKWRISPPQGLERLADFLTRESPWLRLFLLWLLTGNREIAGGPQVRSPSGALISRVAFQFHERSDPDRWFVDRERPMAGRWLTRTHCRNLSIAPDVCARRKGQDDFSWAPLAAPMQLLETVGWLSADGVLTLPDWLHTDLAGKWDAARALMEISARRADVRGFVPAEPTLRELRESMAQISLDSVNFAHWMDELVRSALATGAIELVAVEPGQARHGRGLFGDPTQKLVRWVIHDDFNAHFQRASTAFPRERQALGRTPDGDQRS